jgi:hypothetical protein
MNQRMTYNEYLDFKLQTFVPSMPVTFSSHREYFMSEYGRCPIVYAKYSDNVTFFAECEYCRNGNSLDENDCCIHCGGPVE